MPPRPLPNCSPHMWGEGAAARVQGDTEEVEVGSVGQGESCGVGQGPFTGTKGDGRKAWCLRGQRSFLGLPPSLSCPGQCVPRAPLLPRAPCTMFLFTRGISLGLLCPSCRPEGLFSARGVSSCSSSLVLNQGRAHAAVFGELVGGKG